MNTFKTGDKVRYIHPHVNGYFKNKLNMVHENLNTEGTANFL